MISTLRGIGQVAAFLPYSLGFYPHESVVVVGQIARAIGLTARQDIPPDELVHELAQDLASTFARERHDDVQLFGVCDGPDPLPQLRAMRRAFSAWGIRVDHTVLLDGSGQWKAAQCVCGGCPRQWSPLPDLGSNRVIAELVMRGVAPLSRREDLAACLEPEDPGLLGEVDRLVAAAPAPSIARVGSAVRALVTVPPPAASCSAQDVAVACAGLRSVTVRDTVLAWMLPALVHDEPIPMPVLGEALGPSPESPGALVPALTRWCRSTPEPLRPPVLTLLAASQWDDGGGALGQIACERALQIDPDYTLARLVQRVLGSAIRPTWREHAHTT